MVNQKAKIPGYDNEIWFSEEGITNVLSFVHTFESGLDISYKKPNTFTLKRKKFNGHSDMTFKMHRSGLHYWEDPLAFCMLNTVEENNKARNSRHPSSGVPEGQGGIRFRQRFNLGFEDRSD